MGAVQTRTVIMRCMQVPLLVGPRCSLYEGWGRLQVQGREGFPVRYTSVADCAYRIVREEGVASFWRGSMCSFMKVSSCCHSGTMGNSPPVMGCLTVHLQGAGATLLL